MKALFLILLVCSSASYAQEQLAVRLNEKGIMKILLMAVKYNTSSSSSRTVVIPQDVYSFTIKKNQLLSNPIVSVVNDISDLNLTKDLTFYVQTSNLSVNAKVDPKSLKTAISNSNPNGFDVKLSLNLSSVSASVPIISLCEDRLRNSKKCGAGLKTTVTSLKINTKNAPVSLVANMRVSIKNNMASVKVLSVSSNIDSEKGPGLDINFASLIVPRITIVINDQETELDTSRLKSEILKRKSFLARKLMGFAGEFITSDLAEMINIYLARTKVPTSWQVFDQNDLKAGNFNELSSTRPNFTNSYSFPVTDLNRMTMVRDNTYVRPPVIMSSRAVCAPAGGSQVKGLSAAMEQQIATIIQRATVTLGIKSISTPLNKDIQLAGAISMMLNGQNIQVQNRLSNRTVTALPKLDLNPFRTKYDMSLAISEPVVNGALNVVNQTGLFKQLFESATKLQGVSLKSVQMHFAKDKSLKAIANIEIDLRKLKAKDWWESIMNMFAVYLERNNNNSKIYFPLEISINPAIVNNKGKHELSLYVRSPFNGDTLINSFGYPSNFPNLTKQVREGITKQLQGALVCATNRAYTVDISKFMSQSGVVFSPKSVSFEQGAFMLINTDISDIKFNSKNPFQK